MVLTRWLAAALAIGTCVQALAQGGRLASQTTEGAYRLCVYDMRRSSQVRSRETPALKIGRGEVCPAYMPRERENSEVEAIPSMAVLSGETRLGSQRTCVYSYLGRRYSRPAPIARSCPMTPNLVEWPQSAREPQE